jgi:hypothetical protein
MPDPIDLEHVADDEKRFILSELLTAVAAFQAANIDVVVCGGWVPFLKELSRSHTSKHSMSFDIDIALPEQSRKRELIDQIKNLLCVELKYEVQRGRPFAFEKQVEKHMIELELLADLERIREDEGITQLIGEHTALAVVAIDGGKELSKYLENIDISYVPNRTRTQGVPDLDKVDPKQDGTVNLTITIPNCVGFLMLKTAVMHYRENGKDPYDIAHYCMFSEDKNVIRQELARHKNEGEVASTIERLRLCFSSMDTKWVEMAVEHSGVGPEAKDQEARAMVTAVLSVLPDDKH